MMGKERLVAFSDGVLAIIITIMVLELHIPQGSSAAALRPLAPMFFIYLLSFVNIGIYWNNHHHMLYVTERINGSILWANMHLLFWLSLIPFATGWLGENHFAPAPTAIYGLVLLAASVAYWILQRAILQTQGRDSLLSKAVGRDIKGKICPLVYVLAIALSFKAHWVSSMLYVLVALIWLIPDPRIEQVVTNTSEKKAED